MNVPVTPDPSAVAVQYGLGWGVATGLFGMVIWLYLTTVPKWLYKEAQEDKKALMEQVGVLVGDVRELLRITKDRRG